MERGWAAAGAMENLLWLLVMKEPWLFDEFFRRRRGVGRKMNSAAAQGGKTEMPPDSAALYIGKAKDDNASDALHQPSVPEITP